MQTPPVVNKLRKTTEVEGERESSRGQAGSGDSRGALRKFDMQSWPVGVMLKPPILKDPFGHAIFAS